MTRLILSLCWVSGILIVIAAPEIGTDVYTQYFIGVGGCFVFLLFAVLSLIKEVKNV